MNAGVLVPFVMLVMSFAPVDDPAGVSRQDAEFFEARVRPILVDQCVRCHGPEKQKGGLRLDTSTGMRKGGLGGPVVVPSDPENSTLVQAVRRDGELKMPPDKPLPPEAVEQIVDWVQRGARWSDPAPKQVESEAWRQHWSFQPISNPAPPATLAKGWSQSSVDPFVLAALEARGLTPSPRAERRTLIRRVTFDLIGLPPTPEEVADFVNDPFPTSDAFERVVERLLASPHYGERWGRYWLDVARYADTKGYVFFEDANYPWAYTYRDYVIRSFNEDLPYDRFVTEQIAADKLPLADDRRPLAALGFLTLGGRFMNNAHDIIDDRIDVVTRGFMALTVGCARCHDHKYDPISQKDYYALYGVFASCTEPDVPPLFEPEPKTKDYAVFAKELQKREAAYAAFIGDKREQLVESARTRVGDYMLAAHRDAGQPATENFMLLTDGGDLNPRMLERWRRHLRRTKRTREPVFALWHAFAALPAATFKESAAAVYDKLDPATVNSRIFEALRESPPNSLADVARVYADQFSRAELIWREFELRSRLNGAVADRHPNDAIEALRLVFHGADAPADATAEAFNDLDLLPDRESQGKLQELRKAVETWRATGPGAPPRAMVLEDMSTPREPRVFLRGNPANPGDSVPRQFVRALAEPNAGPFRDGSGRLELARAIASPSNPLTARTLVNRVWMQHFGSPLVATPGDFGMRSEPPTNSALLDHLASEFVEGGWSIKRLHKKIVLSATYQQASNDRTDCVRVDPENRLYWKMNRRRIDFETTRDAILAVSGRLDRKTFGPSVANLLAAGPGRRTLYGFVDRLNLPGLYRAFDYPDPNATSPRRDQTTIPPQALFFMNNSFMQESAKTLMALPAVASAESADGKLDRVYARLFGRAATEGEHELARRYLESEAGSKSRWELLAQGLLMTNEFTFID